MTARPRRSRVATPFFRWVGGKRRLIRQIAPLLPASFANYHEPFLGGGAVFLYLASVGRLRQGAFLADANPDLINAFITVRDDPDGVIGRLGRLAMSHSREQFLAIRNLDRDMGFGLRPAAERAARFIYLANASFNGGWRVDRNGCVVSAPSSGQPRLVDMTAIRTASRFLRSASIECLDFRPALSDERIAPSDLVFLDPPHLARGVTEDPARYTAKRFTRDDQQELDDIIRCLDRRGVHIVLSLAWDDRLAQRFPGFTIHRIDRTGAATEALVANASTRPVAPPTHVR